MLGLKEAWKIIHWKPLERLKKLDIPVGFQVIPINPEEFKTLLKRGSL